MVGPVIYDDHSLDSNATVNFVYGPNLNEIFRMNLVKINEKWYLELNPF
tara:strand:- start:656 stop:802 length:147 start_codon:yes stop_codon:yes gene_type:complete